MSDTEILKHCPECKKKDKTIELTIWAWSEFDKWKLECTECGWIKEYGYDKRKK